MKLENGRPENTEGRLEKEIRYMISSTSLVWNTRE